MIHNGYVSGKFHTWMPRARPGSPGSDQPPDPNYHELEPQHDSKSTERLEVFQVLDSSDKVFFELMFKQVQAQDSCLNIKEILLKHLKETLLKSHRFASQASHLQLVQLFLSLSSFRTFRFFWGRRWKQHGQLWVKPSKYVDMQRIPWDGSPRISLGTHIQSPWRSREASLSLLEPVTNHS